MWPHPLTIFEIQKYYQNKPKFNGVYSRDSLPKIKNEAYIANLNDYESIRGTHWRALYVNSDNVTYLDSFAVKHILKEIKKSKNKNKNRNIITNIYRIQAYNSTMCRYFCTGFIDFRLKGKSLFNVKSIPIYFPLTNMKKMSK